MLLHIISNLMYIVLTDFLIIGIVHYDTHVSTVTQQPGGIFAK